MELGFIGGSSKKSAAKGGGNRGKQQRGQRGDKKKPTWTEDGVPICLGCNRPGHMKRDCPNANAKVHNICADEEDSEGSEN